MTNTEPKQAGGRDRTQEIAVALWLLFGGAVLFFGWHLAMFNKRGGPGPGFFLKSLAVLLIVLALGRASTLANAALRLRHAPVPSPREEGSGFRSGDVMRFLCLVLALTAYAYLMPLLGFLVATVLLGWASLMLLGRHPLRALAEAAVAGFLIRLAFTRGLDVPLPEARLALLAGLGL